MDNVYDRIDVVVSNKEKLTARPVGFEFDDDGNPLYAITYETVCPVCGQVIGFQIQHATIIRNTIHVPCSNCGSGYDIVDEAELDNNKITVKASGQKIKDGKDEKVELCPFIDPMEHGFDPNELYEG